MKNIMKILLGLAAIILITAAPVQSQTVTKLVKDSDIEIWYVNDTITNTETGSYEFGGLLEYKGWSYSVQLVGDSISGTDSCVVYLQESNAYESSGAVWSTISSGTQEIDGAGQTTKVWSGSAWNSARMRLYVDGDGTAATRIRAWVCFKKP